MPPESEEEAREMYERFKRSLLPNSDHMIERE